MSERVGLDLDHTILNYSAPIRNWSNRNGLVLERFDKHSIKAAIFEVAGDDGWQRFQGWLYSEGVLQAEIFPSVRTFIALCQLRGLDVFVVSHKTEKGHFDQSGRSLRGQVIQRLDQLGFVGSGLGKVKREHIFFSETQAEKISKIAELNLSTFIDDLPEIVLHPDLPKSVQAFMFSDGANEVSQATLDVTGKSWERIIAETHGNMTAAELLSLLQEFEPSLCLQSLEEMSGGGNSRAFDANHGEMFVKLYQPSIADGDNRRARESQASKFLQAQGVPVPKLRFTSREVGVSVFDWISGRRIDRPNEGHLHSLLDFIIKLKDMSAEPTAREMFGPATEATFELEDYSSQIENRLERLKSTTDPEIRAFINGEFERQCRRVLTQSREQGLVKRLDERFQILSPSDLGFHNCLEGERGLIFFDFEYFGWDDPARLVGDLLLHPAMFLENRLSSKLIKESFQLFNEIPNFPSRVQSVLPLLALRWQLIVLKPFVPRLMAQGEQSDSDSYLELRLQRLERARRIRQRVLELVP